MKNLIARMMVLMAIISVFSCGNEPDDDYYDSVINYMRLVMVDNSEIPEPNKLVLDHDYFWQQEEGDYYIMWETRKHRLDVWSNEKVTEVPYINIGDFDNLITVKVTIYRRHHRFSGAFIYMGEKTFSYAYTMI